MTPVRRRPRAGGGWPAIRYTLRQARAAGGIVRMLRALRSRNACKTCALGMGGQRGGMVNEEGRFPEVCKKSVQAMAADLQGAVRFDEAGGLSLERLRTRTPRELEAMGRLTRPLRRAPMSDRYEPVEWDDALDRIAGAICRAAPDRTYHYFSGRSSNEAGFLLQLLARLTGTNNVNNCSYYCHQASGVGLKSITGSGTATVVLEDLDRCDLVVLIGANPASNHPRFMRSLMALKRRGGRVVVLNPLREVGLERFKVPSDPRSLLFGTTIADRYLQPHVGGDLAVLTGAAKAILERGAEDRSFLESATDGWDAVRASLASIPWESIEAESGLLRAELETLADELQSSSAAVFAWAMGITHHAHGVRNVQAIGTLAAMTGMLGRPGAGLLPLRGHSNVQGIGSMGVVPRLEGAVAEAIERRLGVTLPGGDGLDTLACLEAARAGRMDVGVHLGGNLFGASPDAPIAAEALQRVGLTVFLSTTLNTGHVFGLGRQSIIFPVLARDEEPQPTTQESMFNFVRLSDGGRSRHAGAPGGGPRSEVALIAALGERIWPEPAYSPVRWDELRSHAAIRALVAEVIPGYAAIGAMDERGAGSNGAGRPRGADLEFQIEGRTFHAPRFGTPSGRAVLHPFALAGHGPLAADELRLTSLRSEGQFNTVVYEDHDLYRGQHRRDVIMLAEADCSRLGLAIDQPVEVTGPAGHSMVLHVGVIDLPPGNAAVYYPETNALIPTAADPGSRTPSFKHVRVRIRPVEPASA